jgi:hypothetical protein
MAQELELRIAVQVGDVALLAGEQVVDAEYFLAAREQPVAQVGTEEARSTRDERAVFKE